MKPDTVLSSSMEKNALQAVCQNGTICITPYADNILHVAYYPNMPVATTMWGIVATPDESCSAQRFETDDYISLSLKGVTSCIHKDCGAITFTWEGGNKSVTLTDYSLEPVQILGEHTFHVSMNFSADSEEHFYGLGQHQDGILNLAGREHVMWHDYSHKGGEVVAVPYLISDKKYGILLDNPSRSTIKPGVDNKTIWEAEVGDCVSFFFIAATQTDDLYKAYRKLSGITPLPPRRGLGFIQCKQRYSSEQELLNVAETYYKKGYPCDIFVVDWFHWKVLGDLCVDPNFWPDSKEMNRKLSEMGYETMISCWPRFMKESIHYDFLEQNGWFMKDENGETVYGTPEDQRGALIDTTNPDCGKWYADTIQESYGKQGYKYWWTDENEPDISPHSSYLHTGTGARIHNIYPLTHSKCIYEGHRKHREHRCLTLSRAAWTGAQSYGTTFWSSDIFPTWNVLKRQIPTALNFCASGMPYWSSDIGGWQSLPGESSDEDYSSLLISTENDNMGIVTKKNYTELYVRWFQFGVFCPTFRTHGTRKHNEVWSYGEEAEKILVEYLKLRYRLMPYIYSLARNSTETGAPFMRALWMDFSDRNCTDIDDEFMFGPAMLIAPVVEQGAVSREVYLPEGCKWYDFYTNELLDGGSTVIADAPIDRIPIYIKAGSIIPMGEPVKNMEKPQTQIEAFVYPGADCCFRLYSDDGHSYRYEDGDYILTELVWNDKNKEFSVKNLHSCESLDKENVVTHIIK